MLGHIVRIVLLVRVDHLLLGWWWEVFTSCGKTPRVNQERKRKMAKNMTRKSIASAAVISLGLVGLSALPAQAALSSVTIAPLSGTNSNFLADAGFVLQATGAGAGASEDIEYLIEGAVASDFTAVDFGYTTSALSTITAQSDLNGSASVATQSASDNTSVIAPSTAWQPANTNLIWMEFDESNITTATTITITAFRDDVTANDEYDAGEAKLGSYTFTVHPSSALTASLTTSDPGIGSVQAKSNVKFSDVNMASIIEDGNIGKVDFTLNGSKVSISFQSDEYSAAKDAFVVEEASARSYAANDVLVTLPYILDDSTAGNGATTQVATSIIDSIGAVGEFGDDHVATSGGSTADAVRAGSGSFTVFTDVTATSGKSNAGAPITWTIEEVSNSSTLSGTITAGGSSLTNATAGVVDSIDVDVTASASGRASLTLSYSGLKAGDTFKVTATAKTDDGANGSQSDTYTVVTPQYKDVVVDNYYGGNMRAVENGDTVSVDLLIRDDFGTPLQTAARVDYLVDAASSGDKNGTSATTTNGRVTVSYTDNNVADATDVFEYSDVDVANSAGVLTAQTDSGDLFTVKSFKSLDTATRVVISNDSDDTNSSITTSTLAAGNERTTDADAGTYTEYITATVYGSKGAALAGVPVTVSSSGLYFGVEDDGATNDGVLEISSKDSITVYTNASGVANVYYHSNSAGKFVISATSGSGSDATAAGAVSFSAAASSTGASISFAGSDSTATSGSTFKIVGTLTDKFGNPVEVTSSDTERVRISYVGDGITLPSTLPTTTDSNGQMSFSVLLGANDSDDGVVTMTYDLNGDSDLTDLGDITATFTVDVNPEPVVDQKVNAGSFKGYVAVYARGYEGQRLSAKIGNDWVVADPIVNNQEDDTLFRVTDFTGAGYDIAVRIYIDRVLLATIPLTTK